MPLCAPLLGDFFYFWHYVKKKAYLSWGTKLGAEAHSTGVIPVIHLNLSHGGEAQKSWGLGIHH